MTDMGRDTLPVLLAIMRWGDTWLAEDGPPVEVIDPETGERIQPLVVDANTGEPIPSSITVKPLTAAAMADRDRRAQRGS